MIDRFQFLDIIDPLMRYVGKTLEDDIVSMYAGALRNYDEADLRRAVSHLVETWTGGMFPRISHIKDAIAETAVSVNYATLEDLEEPCGDCAGGIQVYEDAEGYVMARPCGCSLGRRRGDALRRWHRRSYMGATKQDERRD